MRPDLMGSATGEGWVGGWGKRGGKRQGEFVILLQRRNSTTNNDPKEKTS